MKPNTQKLYPPPWWIGLAAQSRTKAVLLPIKDGDKESGNPLKKTYWEKLKDPRWQRRRLEVMQAANFRCEDCNDGGETLEVHHTAYTSSLEPWEHDITTLMCLCSTCHQHRQSREDAIKINLGKYLRVAKPDELEAIAWDIISIVSNHLTKKYAEAFS